MGSPEAERRPMLLVYLYVTIFLTSMAYGTITFLVPVYAEELGASYVTLGVLGAVGSVVYTVMTLVSGFLLDRFERVRFYLGTTALGILVILLFSFTTSISQLMLVRGTLGIVAATFWVTASTLTADISPPEALTRSVGRYNISWILGFTVGPVIGGLISDIYGFRTLFGMLSIPVILSVMVILARISRNIKLKNSTGGSHLNFEPIRHLVVAYVALLPFTLILGIYMAILPGHMRAIGVPASAIGMLLTMTNGVRGIGFINVERFVKWGTRRSLVLATLLLAVGLYLVSVSASTLGFIVPLSMYGFAAGIITPVVLDYIAHRTPGEALGTAMGLHEGIYGVGMSFGPLIGGAIAENFQPSTLYIGLAALSLLILPLSYRMESRSNDGG